MDQQNVPHVMIVEDEHLIITNSASASSQRSGSGLGSASLSLLSSKELQPTLDSIYSSIPGVATHPQSKEETVMVRNEKPAQHVCDRQ